MAEIVSNVKTGKRRTKGSLMKIIQMTLKDKMSNSVVSSKREKGQWLEQKKCRGAADFSFYF